MLTWAKLYPVMKSNVRSVVIFFIIFDIDSLMEFAKQIYFLIKIEKQRLKEVYLPPGITIIGHGGSLSNPSLTLPINAR